MPQRNAPAPHEPTPALLAGIDAALRRPVLLDPTALAAVRGASAFQRGPRADAGGAGGASLAFVRDGDVAVVAIEGPLSQRAWSCMGLFAGDGYDAIQARVQKALDDASVRAVVLRFDSPGGEVAGCFEAVRAIRAAAEAAGKPVVAYADEMACSAAYALACAADEIVLPDTGVVGSVGVIVALLDESEALRAEGLAVNVITSGAAKADGHPAVPLSDDARARVQGEIDYLADVFAREVAEARPLEAGAVRALEARVFYGPAAKDAGLADQVGNLTDAVARARELAAQRTKRKNMQNVAKKLSLPHDASEADILANVTALQDDLAAREQKIDAHEKTIEALSHDLAQARAEAKAERERGEKIEREREIEAAKAAGQWAPALEGFLGTLSAEQLKTWRASAPRVVPQGEIKQPPAPPAADAQLSPAIAELATKKWGELTAREKHAITTHDPKLAERMRAAAADAS